MLKSRIVIELSALAAVVVIAMWYMKPKSPLQPNLFVAVSYMGQNQTTFRPEGGGWIAGDQVEITLFGEPTSSGGEIISGPPRTIGKVTAYDGMFGYISNTLPITIPHSLCGSPPAWLPDPYFTARDTKGGPIAVSKVGSYSWFTFKPC
jgi:hypothetical protein